MTDHKHPDIANLLIEMYDRNVSREEHDRKVVDEVTRQLIYGQPPSEGLPDARPNYPRYEQYVYGSGDGSGPQLDDLGPVGPVMDTRDLQSGDILTVRDGKMTIIRAVDSLPWYRRLLAWVVRGLIRLRDST